MILYTSNEDYLETILQLEKKKDTVRSIDIVEVTGFTKPSVSGAMKNLRTNGYIIMEEDHSIHLTDEGRKIAENVYERHQFFKEWLIEIGVNPETAEHDACKIEHAISEESFQKLKAAYKKK